MKKIKLLICYHKPDILLQDEILTPIHVGRALALKNAPKDDPKLAWMLENMIGDDTGDNISLRNGSYNELTSLYWAWKNYDKLGNPDFIGLMHYRRHFVFRESEIKVYEVENRDMAGSHYLEELNYSPETLSGLLEGCDFACHLGRVDSIYKHFLDNHRREDLDLALSILYRKYPAYKKVAEKYIHQDIGNFCNMFILSKPLFFEYCEWIFSILQEFEETVDIQEKRLFISERLSGIFIYNLIQKKLNYKVFPIAFVAEPLNIPIAMPLDPNNPFPLATTILSALQNAGKTTAYTFYLICDQTPDAAIRERFDSIARVYPKVSFSFIESGVEKQYYPLEISEKLPHVNKCVYLTDRFLILQDLSEFFRTCSVDDYYICGLPLDPVSYDVTATAKTIEDSALMIHCARFRKYRLLEKSKQAMAEGASCIDILNKICYHQIGYFPYWFTTFTDALPSQKVFADPHKSRSAYQADALCRPLLYYRNLPPWIDCQATYSNFWWNMARLVPRSFPFVRLDLEEVRRLFAQQQIEINEAGEWLRGREAAPPQPKYEPINAPQPENAAALPPNPDDEWAKASLWTKAKEYYRLHGFVRTLGRIWAKLFSGG